MKTVRANLDGLLILEPLVFKDAGGCFMEIGDMCV